MSTPAAGPGQAPPTSSSSSSKTRKPIPTYTEEDPLLANSTGAGGRFAPLRSYQDVCWIVLFIVHFVLLIVVVFAASHAPRSHGGSAGVHGGGTSATHSPSQNTTSGHAGSSGSSELDEADLSAKWAGTTCLGMLITGSFGTFLVAFVRYSPKHFIQVASAMGLVAIGISAIIFCLHGLIAAGLLSFLALVIEAESYYSLRSRMDFGTQLLTCCQPYLAEYKAIVLFGFTFMIVNCFWGLMWLAVAVVATSVHSAFIFVLLISLIWNLQIVLNTYRVTVSGSFSRWYFHQISSGTTRDFNMKSFQSACTTAFGSICFGSAFVFYVGIFQSISNVLSSLRLGAVASSCSGCVNKCLRYFNKQSFVHVAIYGKPYLRAAKDAWDGASAAQLVLPPSEDSVLGVTSMLTVAGGLLGGSVGLSFMGHAPDLEYFYVITGFGAGSIIVSHMCAVIDTCATSLLVCLAEDPHPYKAAHGDLYSGLGESWRSTFGSKPKVLQ